jgi:hypothetical protein
VEERAETLNVQKPVKTHANLSACPVCGGIKERRSKTCGKCAGKGYKENGAATVTCQCEYCHDNFLIPEWRYKQGRGRFCSVDCKNAHLATLTGEDNMRFAGKNVAPWEYSGTSWQEARSAVTKRADGHCEWCGIDFKEVKRIVVHHHVGVHEFNNPDDGHTPDNMVAICQSCHAKHHGLGKISKKGGDAHV